MCRVPVEPALHAWCRTHSGFQRVAETLGKFYKFGLTFSRVVEDQDCGTTVGLLRSYREEISDGNNVM